MTDIMTKAIVKLPKTTNRHYEAIDDFLVTDKLYIDGLPSSVVETEIMDLVESCEPTRIHLNRNHDSTSGYIQFTTKEMADRAYTLLNGVTIRGDISLQLKINSPSGDNPEPEAHAGILHIKNLPCNTNNKSLYELFRPFGPMILCKILLDQSSTFKGAALVQYFHSEHAQHAQDAMNNKTVHDNVISVFPYVSSRVKSFISTPEPTIPRSSISTTAIPTPVSPAPAPTITSSTPQIRSDGSSMVDYTNLYIKNLDLNVKSADLFNNFRRFGRIISARVMKNAQTKQSKGFGFVSFSKADEAQKAKQEMNNQYILSKPVIVAFHEPKKARDMEVSPPNSTFNASYQQAAASVSPVLVQRQQPTYTRPSPTQPLSQNDLFEQPYQLQYYQHQKHNNHNGYNQVKNNTNNNRDLSDQRYNTRNTTQKYNNTYQQQQQDHRQPSPTPTNGVKNNHYQPMARNNSSSSAYHHHANNSLGIYELQRQPQQQNQHIHPQKRTYEALYNAPLKRNPSASGSVQHPNCLSSLTSGVYMHSPGSVAMNTPSSTTVVSINNGYPHHPHHPQQQYAVSPPVQSQTSNHQYRHQPTITPQERPTFRRRGSVESATSAMTETSSETRRHTITKAVLVVEKVDMKDLQDIVDMLLTLKKKDLATCLFNRDFLKSKIKQAKDALIIFQEQQHDDHEAIAYERSPPLPQRVSPPSPPAVNYYYSKQDMMTSKFIQEVSLPPKGSRAIPIIAPPSVSTPVVDRKYNPAMKDKELREEIKRILSEMKGLELHQQKQKLGNILFPLVKSTGVKQAPKITIRLLDSIPLDELAYSMHDKDKLKTQVSQVEATISAHY